MKLSIAFSIALALAGCATQPDTLTRVVDVPSSKPYKFIQWSVADTEETRRAVRAHNRAHQAVIDAEKAAK
jgi:hypothetical protein